MDNLENVMDTAEDVVVVTELGNETSTGVKVLLAVVGLATVTGTALLLSRKKLVEKYDKHQIDRLTKKGYAICKTVDVTEENDPE